MKVMDFLKPSTYLPNIVVKDLFNNTSKEYRHKEEVLNKYGYNTLQSWCIENGKLVIVIRSQF